MHDPARPLDGELLARILGRANRSTSGFDLQPWRFVVVRTPRNRRRLRALAFGRASITEADVVVIVLGYLRGWETDLIPMLERRVALGAMSPEAMAEARARAVAGLARIDDRAGWAKRSAMIAVGAMMMAAAEEGVACSLIDQFDEPRLRDEFGIPDDHAACCFVALGLPHDPGPAEQFGLGHVCSEEHFGRPWTLGDPGV